MLLNLQYYAEQAGIMQGAVQTMTFSELSILYTKQKRKDNMARLSELNCHRAALNASFSFVIV